MEEEKAAAYYDELTRKGSGAARFKQGLGFSSEFSDAHANNNNVPSKGSALPSSSSFLNNFVRASSPGKVSEIEKQTQLENIQNKLKKKQSSESQPRVSDHESRDGSKYDLGNDSRRSRRRSSSRERDRYSRRRSRSRDSYDSRRRHRSSSRDRDRDRGRRSERRRRSRSRSYSDEEGRRRRDSRERKSRGRRSRSSSPRRSEKSRSNRDKDRGEGRKDKEKNGGIDDYSRLIEGYAEMTPAERVKAKMKLQLSQTVEKDTAKGVGAGWERFEFNKDAPLDDEEIEAAEDDKVLVKHMGQSFRFSAVEARREEEIKAAHDEAMFGAPAAPSPIDPDKEPMEDSDGKETNENIPVTNLVSEKVLAKQQGTWRDRARKLQDRSTS